MYANRHEVLLLMLSDILHEADTLRPQDPIKAAHLDDAANDLRTVLAEGEGESPELDTATH